MSLKQLKNLGPVSVRKLNNAGIETEDQLRSLGAVEAYLQVKQSQSNISLNLLYALHGALTGRNWNRIDELDRTALLLEVDAREALPADDQSVTKLKNIGITLAGRLAGSGIRTRADLNRIGVVEAYRQMQANSPNKLPVCYNLYALEGALRGCHWSALPEKIKDELYFRVKGKPRPGRLRKRR